MRLIQLRPSAGGGRLRAGLQGRANHRCRMGLIALITGMLTSCASPQVSGHESASSPAKVPERSASQAVSIVVPAIAADERAVQLQHIDCEETKAALRDGLLTKMEEEMAASLERYRGSAATCMQQHADRDTRKNAMSVRARSGSHPGAVRKGVTGSSSTNVIAEGVDEADLVKHDGQYLYLLANGSFSIFSIDPQGSVPANSGRSAGYRTSDYLRLLSRTPVPSGMAEFFLAEGRVVLVGVSAGTKIDECQSNHTCVSRGDGGLTEVLVLDVSKPAAPREVRRVQVSGGLLASRRIEKTVHLVVSNDFRPAFEITPPHLPCYVPSNEDYVLAQFERLKAANRKIIEDSLRTPTWSEQGDAIALCNDAVRLPGAAANAFTTLVSFDLTADGSPPHAVSLVSAPGAIHVAPERLLLAVPRGALSDLHTFHLGGTPSLSSYEGSGVLDGHVTNDFSMDASGGHLTVVTETNGASALSTLARTEDGVWAPLGQVKGIAPGEELRAVRFVERRAYLVTFEQTDPLFVVNLVNPRNPEILGELKIPGFSTYLHPMEREHLISVGFAASRGRTQGLLLQMFDVTHPRAPRLRHREHIGNEGSVADAAVDHHAFTYLPKDELLVVPVNLCFTGAPEFQGLEVFRVNDKSGFTRLGRIHHRPAKTEPRRGCDASLGRGASSMYRSVVVDGLIVSVHDDSIKAQHLQRLKFDSTVLSLLP